MVSPVDQGGSVNVRADGFAQVEVVISAPAGKNYEIEIDWGDPAPFNRVENYPPENNSAANPIVSHSGSRGNSTGPPFDGELVHRFSHKYFGNPNSDITGATVGTISSLAGDPRAMQFSVRLHF